MEQLIRFLLGNIHFVIVVLGILFVLLRKSPLEKPPGDKPGSRPSGRMPDFGGGGLPRPMRPASDPKPAPRPTTAQQPIERREGPAMHERRQPPIVTLPARPQSSNTAEEGRGAAAGDKQIVYRSPGSPPPAPVPWAGEGESGGEGAPSASAAQAAREDAAYHAAAKASPLYASAQSQGAGAPARPRHSELARAVLWAEILGPPRSRKPFRR
ncbi:hypothetical protein SAMN05216312_106191 [Cohnella sp. OV330]|uniref:hypothetical protein n=1 Tax=Cohnella sp. OV330 TaxID=1855288 RepID=UPI0008F24498|nr:hypothetical protein [Cohnella sp. OV330]SFB35233.1 hypothetical protein SAMN05216312_106191 [Cohnella sp. OV330]